MQFKSHNSDFHIAQFFFRSHWIQVMSEVYCMYFFSGVLFSKAGDSSYVPLSLWNSMVAQSTHHIYVHVSLGLLQ